MTTTKYPNGQVLTSTALTQKQLTAILQELTCGVLGINPPDYSLVRVDWNTQGQPFEDVSNDICYLSCVPEDTEYNRIRDMTMVSGANQEPTEQWTYTRGWKVSWCLYGPASTDRARMLHSAVYMDYFCNALAIQNLYPIPDAPQPTRVPELINAQWWERADFHVELYESITETIADGAVQSVEMQVDTVDGKVADFTVNKEL